MMGESAIGKDLLRPDHESGAGAVRASGLHIERPVALACLLILAVGCWLVLRPFASALIWGIILTISTWPLHVRLTRLLGGRRSLSAAILVLTGAAIFLVPLIILGRNLSESVIQLVASLRAMLETGLPMPPPWVEGLPLIGPRIAASWAELAGSGTDITTTLTPYLGQVRNWALSLGALVGSGIVEILLSLLIAFFFYRDGNRAVEDLSAVLERIAGPFALRLLDAASGTLKGVVHGVLGTNAIQAILAGIGFRLAGVPGALFLAFLCFFLTLVPGGPTILWLPAAIWLFRTGETGWAIFLIVWNLVTFGALESILRTYLIGRGSPLPTLLILFGLLGGLMAFGFIGLFLGPCLLALGFTLIQAWSGIHREAP